MYEFAEIKFNKEYYPIICLPSIDIRESSGQFLVNPQISINIIDESKLLSTKEIDRSEILLINQGSLITTGSIHLLIANKSVKFYTIKNNISSEIVGIVGSSFLTISPEEFSL